MDVGIHQNVVQAAYINIQLNSPHKSTIYKGSIVFIRKYQGLISFGYSLVIESNPFFILDPQPDFVAQ